MFVCVCLTKPAARYARCKIAARWHNLTFLSISVNGTNRQRCRRRPQSPWLIHDVGGGKQEQTEAVCFFLFVCFLVAFFFFPFIFTFYLSSRRWAKTTLLIAWWELRVPFQYEARNNNLSGANCLTPLLLPKNHLIALLFLHFRHVIEEETWHKTTQYGNV